MKSLNTLISWCHFIGNEPIDSRVIQVLSVALKRVLRSTAADQICWFS